MRVVGVEQGLSLGSCCKGVSIQRACCERGVPGVRSEGAGDPQWPYDTDSLREWELFVQKSKSRPGAHARCHPHVCRPSGEPCCLLLCWHGCACHVLSCGLVPCRCRNGGTSMTWMTGPQQPRLGSATGTAEPGSRLTRLDCFNPGDVSDA